MNGLNKVQIIGRVGQEPKVNIWGNGTTVELNVCTNEKVKDGEAFKEVAVWHSLVLHSRYTNTDFVQAHVHSGAMVFAEGKLEYYTYTSKMGQFCKSVRIRVTNFILLAEAKKSEPADDLPFGNNEQGGTF